MQKTILAFGAHPDDVEIGMAGSIAKWTKNGHRVFLVDVTDAELSSNGNVLLREEEARQSMHVLGVEERIQCHIPDRDISGTHVIDSFVSIIRKVKPNLIFYPYQIDRHPDHVQTSLLVKEAIFSSGLRKYKADLGAVWKADDSYAYFIHGIHRPNLIVDISETIGIKKQSLLCYQSQFTHQDNSVKTILTEEFIETVIARNRVFGHEIGVSFGEGFLTEKPILWNV